MWGQMLLFKGIKVNIPRVKGTDHEELFSSVHSDQCYVFEFANIWHCFCTEITKIPLIRSLVKQSMWCCWLGKLIEIATGLLVPISIFFIYKILSISMKFWRTNKENICIDNHETRNHKKIKIITKLELSNRPHVKKMW